MYKCIHRFIYLASIISLGRAATISVKDTFRLPSGDLMPYVGFGTYLVKGDDIIFNDLDNALSAGYRLIDTAQVYENEEAIGKALKVLLPKYNLTRKDVFITSKLSVRNLGTDALTHVESSLKKLGLDYLDLYLIHFPGLTDRDVKPNSKTDSVLRDEAWQQLAQAVKKGWLRNIGISNYNVRHMKELIKNDHGVKPAVNQVRWNPFHYQQELLDYCKSEGVLLQAWASLGGTNTTESLLGNPTVIEIAKKLNKTPAQVLLRWALQQGVGIIPKASSKERIEENFKLDFTISDEDIKTLNNFEQQPAFSKWNPDNII